MDLVRAGLGYLARADVASLPAVTQARLLREYERAQSQHTAGRVRALSAFTAQGAYADDGHGGPHPWLAWQTRVTARAASATIGWMRRLGAHPLVAAALAAGTVTESYARKICYWSDLLPVGYRELADQNLAAAAAGGADLDFLSQMAEEMFSRVTPPDKDDEDDARFNDRFFRLTRLFQGHGRADGDLTPECLAAVTEVLDTLGKKAGPEDDRSAGQRGHDALEEAMRLLLASGCLPERAGQAAQVQLHLTLDELLDMPGGTGAASAWLANHLAASTSGDGEAAAARPARTPGRPRTSASPAAASAWMTRRRTARAPASPAPAAARPQRPALGPPGRQPAAAARRPPGPTWMSCWAPTPATRSPRPGPAPPAAPPPAPGSPAGSPAKPPRPTRVTRR